MVGNELKQKIARIRELAARPLLSDLYLRRVEIIILKFKEKPEIVDKAISRIIHNTDHPFKLTIFDNRQNPANTSKIWNKLVQSATCRYTLLIDSDAFVPVRKEGEKCWLTRMMESIDETGVVIPVSSAPGGAHQHVSGPEPYPSVTRNKDIWSGYCFLFDLDAYKRVGPFNERFYIYGQDSEFAHRVGMILGGAVMRKDVFVEHVGGASFKSDPDREDDKLYARALFKFLTKNEREK